MYIPDRRRGRIQERKENTKKTEGEKQRKKVQIEEKNAGIKKRKK